MSISMLPFSRTKHASHPGPFAIFAMFMAFSAGICASDSIDIQPSGTVLFDIRPISLEKNQPRPSQVFVHLPFNGVSTTVASTSEISVPSNTREFLNIHVEGESFWSLVLPGNSIRFMQHVCCGVQIDNPSFWDDVNAVFPVNSLGKPCARESDCACPKGKEFLDPGLANDEFGRCIALPQVRIVNTSNKQIRIPNPFDPDNQAPALSAAPSIESAKYQTTDGYLNVAHTLLFITQAPGDKSSPDSGKATLEYITLSPSSRYTVWINENGISRITYDGRF